MARVLGVDFGTKRIGFAFGDSFSGMAVPMDVVELDGVDPVKLIWGMVQEDEYDLIVVGTPLTAEGGATDMSEVVDKFAESLRSVVGVEVVLVNEYLTSKASDMLMDEVGLGKGHDDAVAAMIILQEYFNNLG